MVNIILITLLISLFTQYIMKTPLTTLNCGLWGFFGENNNKFNWNKFNIIGLFNDKRGGDACGRSIGTKYFHYNDRNNKKYEDLLTNVLNPNYNDNNIILGHTRKISVGVSGTDDIEFTQPYPFRDENDDIIGMGMHNGTLYNTDDLKRKYNLPINLKYIDNDGKAKKHVLNDSQVLLYSVLVKKNYKILEEYNGSAVLVWYNFKENRLYLYKGFSKINKSSNFGIEERPLYIMQEKNNIWFSSIEKPLWIISQNRYPSIKEAKANTILIYEKGVLVDEISITRKSTQNKEYTSPSVGFNNWYHTANNYRQNSLPSNFEKDEMRIEDESIPFIKDNLIYGRGRYWVNNKKAHGIYHVKRTGDIAKTACKDGTIWQRTKPFYFIEGVMIENHSAFQALIREYNTIHKNKVEDFLLEKVLEFAEYPVHRYNNFIQDMSVWDNNSQRGRYYTGTIHPLFSAKRYTFKLGDLEQIDSSQYKMPSEEYYSPKPVPDDDNTLGKSEEDFTIKSNIYLEKLPFDTDDDDMEEMEEELAKTEVLCELSNVLSSISTCKNSIAIYSDSSIGKSALNILDKTERFISKIGDND